MRALDAIDVQLDLLRYYNSGAGKRMMASYHNDIHKNMMLMLQYASPVWVAPNIAAMLRDAVDTLPDDVSVKDEDIPLDVGFAVFAGEPWKFPIDTPTGFSQWGTAILWSRADIGVNFIVFGLSARPNAKAPTTEKPAFLNADSFDFSLPVNDFTTLITEVKRLGGPDGIVHHMYHEADQNGNIVEITAESTVDEVLPWYASTRLAIRKMLVSLWLFMGQKIASKETYSFDRATRRSLPDNYLGEHFVRMVDLRRRENKQNKIGNDEPAWHLTKRHIVTAHWHSYWVKVPGKEEKERKQLWLQAYVKGPDGAPMIEGVKLFKVVR